MKHDIADRILVAIFLCLGLGFVALLVYNIIASRGFLLIPLGIFGVAYLVAGPILDRMGR
jgi:hypothetical protein